MHRRELLALCGGLVSVAGCTARRRDGRQTTTTPTTTPSTDPGTQTATPADVELTVELDALQPALVVLNVDYLDLYSNPSSQYLYLRISAPTDRAPTRSALSFRFDDERHAPMGTEEMPEVYRSFTSESPPQYDADEGSGWVLFELPATGDASDAALVWPGGEWAPDESLRARLAAPLPPLAVEEWRVPRTVPLHGRTTFRLAVRNTGEVLGRFVGGINADGWYPHRPVARLSREIPPGETVAWEIPGETIDPVTEGLAEQVGDGDADLHYDLLSPDGTRSASVRVVED